MYLQLRGSIHIIIAAEQSTFFASRAKQSEIVNLQLTNQILHLHITLQYFTIPTMTYIRILSCNTYCDPIGHSEARGCEQCEIVNLQLTNQIPDVKYPTIPSRVNNKEGRESIELCIRPCKRVADN